MFVFAVFVLVPLSVPVSVPASVPGSCNCFCFCLCLCLCYCLVLLVRLRFFVVFVCRILFVFKCLFLCASFRYCTVAVFAFSCLSLSWFGISALFRPSPHISSPSSLSVTVSPRTVGVAVVSSRTDLYDDDVDVMPLSALDAVEVCEVVAAFVVAVVDRRS